MFLRPSHAFDSISTEPDIILAGIQTPVRKKKPAREGPAYY